MNRAFGGEGEGGKPGQTFPKMGRYIGNGGLVLTLGMRWLPVPTHTRKCSLVGRQHNVAGLHWRGHTQGWDTCKGYPVYRAVQPRWRPVLLKPHSRVGHMSGLPSVWGYTATLEASVTEATLKGGTHVRTTQCMGLYSHAGGQCY